MVLSKAAPVRSALERHNAGLQKPETPTAPEGWWRMLGEVEGGTATPESFATLTEPSGRQRWVTCIKKLSDSSCLEGACGVISVEGTATSPEVAFLELGVPVGFFGGSLTEDRGGVELQSVGTKDLNNDGVLDLDLVVDVRVRRSARGQLHHVHVLAEGNGFRRPDPLPYQRPKCLPKKLPPNQ